MYPSGTFITVPLSVLPRNETSGETRDVVDSNVPVVTAAVQFVITVAEVVVVVVVVSEVRETSPLADISSSEAVVVVVAADV